MIADILANLKHKWEQSKYKTSKGYKWRKLRNKYIGKNPYCEICGYYSLKNDVHHIIPKHIAPDLEYDKNNLMTLCSRYKCHLRFGHFGNYSKYYNPHIRELKSIGKKMIEIEKELKNIRHYENI